MQKLKKRLSRAPWEAIWFWAYTGFNVLLIIGMAWPFAERVVQLKTPTEVDGARLSSATWILVQWLWWRNAMVAQKDKWKTKEESLETSSMAHEALAQNYVLTRIFERLDEKTLARFGIKLRVKKRDTNP